MAILIRGATKCSICNKVMQEGDEVVSFPPFIPNELDPLYFFHDAAFHADCFHSHRLAGLAQKRYRELEERALPPYIDTISGEIVDDPDDHFTFGHLTDNKSNPLYIYNYAHLSRSHLPSWAELDRAYELIKQLQSSGTWKGSVLDWIIDVLEDAIRKRRSETT